MDSGEAFTGVSAILFTVVDGQGNACALCDKNEGGVAAELSLGDLVAAFEVSITISVRVRRAPIAADVFVADHNLPICLVWVCFARRAPRT